jgi:hypothetical protein
MFSDPFHLGGGEVCWVGRTQGVARRHVLPRATFACSAGAFLSTPCSGKIIYENNIVSPLVKAKKVIAMVIRNALGLGSVVFLFEFPEA